MSGNSREEVIEKAVAESERKTGKKPGELTERHRTAWDGLELAWEKIRPGEKFRKSMVLEHTLHTVLYGDMKDNERASLLLTLMKFLYPTLKAVDHTGTVSQVQVQLTHKEIEEILKNDPFRKARSVSNELNQS